MLRDRIVEAGAKRILLPAWCAGPAGSVSVNELRAILGSDRHSLLVTGDTGTGKEMLADCVMAATKRPRGKCQRINCAGLDRNLVGSELFGHKKGAYTGADAPREGLLKACDGGVLFLDEVGWLPEDLQARLLRFMEDGRIRPLGADVDEKNVADVRIVAATNKDAEKVLIHDLRHRFDFEVRLPGLRERGADVFWFLCERGFLGGEEVFTGITLRALLGLLACEWTGNVRELKKYCQRRCVLRGVDATGACELAYVLDDPDLGGGKALGEWFDLAGAALAAVEEVLKKDDSPLQDPNVGRLVDLLVGIARCRWDGEVARLGRVDVPVIPLSVLRSRVAGEAKDPCGFDFRFLNSVLTPHFRGVDMQVVLAMETDLGVSEFPDALVVLKRFVAAFAKVHLSEKVEFYQDSRGSLAAREVGPSKGFWERVGRSRLDGVLFGIPAAPGGTAGIEVALDALGIGGVEREMCVLCSRQKSNGEIAAALRVAKSAVTETLTNMRSHETLRPYLPKQAAGRKPKRA